MTQFSYDFSYNEKDYCFYLKDTQTKFEDIYKNIQEGKNKNYTQKKGIYYYYWRYYLSTR